MVVCYEKKCIFIHIPKTAGTSVEQFLKDNGKNEIDFIGVRNNRSLQHLTALELSRMVQFFNKYYKFSIVRNPYDRLLSEYYWTPLEGYKSGKSKMNFLNYVSNIIIHKKYLNNIYNDHFIPQYFFLFNKKKKLLVNEVFKYENLEVSIDYLKKKLDINRDFPILNKSNLDIKKEVWTEEEKEKIYKMYMIDFIVFKYDK
jgi:hypothetical protein